MTKIPKPKEPGRGRKSLRNQALARDNATCQICGLKDEVVMEVDHILPKSKRPDLAESLENLLTLCANCHRRKTARSLRNNNI